MRRVGHALMHTNLEQEKGSVKSGSRCDPQLCSRFKFAEHPEETQSHIKLLVATVNACRRDLAPLRDGLRARDSDQAYS